MDGVGLGDGKSGMRYSAIRERAQARLSALRAAAARVRARDLAIVLGRVAAVLLGLELVYLVAGNALLRSQVIQRAVGDADGFALEFGGAYTLWPGHARVHDLSLRVEDYNVQFEVAIARAELDIALSELPFKKFHVTRLDAEGTRFRMRHKLISVGADAERVAAYPKIKGFADPPYFVGVHPPAISDAEADTELWKLRIENVRAAVQELWVMEYRYQGPGRARGSFAVHPTRWVQVEPATLWLDGGSLTLGEHVVAAKVEGKLDCDIPDMHVQAREGLAVLKDISARAKLALGGGKLDFLRAYLGRLGSARYAGSADYRVDIALQRGELRPRSRVDVRATPFELHHELGDLRGDVMLSLQREQAPALELAVSAPRLVAGSRRGEPGPYFEGLVGSLTLDGADLTEPMALGDARLAVARAHADSLDWFSRPAIKLGGAADARFELHRKKSHELGGAARVELRGGSLEHADVGLTGDLNGEVAWSRGPDSSAPLELGKLRLQLLGATLRSGGKRSKSFDAVVQGSGLELEPSGSVRAAGKLRARVSSAEALLPLVMGAPLKSLASTALDLKQLDAETQVQLSRHGVSLNGIEARSGNLRARGYFRQEKSEPRGAFLLSSGLLNVGVTLSGGETEISPFVGDGWLAATWPRISRAPGGPS